MAQLGCNNFPNWLQECRKHTENILEKFLKTTENSVPISRLYQAMRYSVLGRGKRIRAILVYATGLANQFAQQEQSFVRDSLDHAAAAVELIHSYSLIHDDLPCMDNAILRRGKPALHIQFGEAIALLAGDALQSLAFELLANISKDPDVIVNVVRILANSSGVSGMVGGQMIDLASVNHKLSTEEIKFMYTLKTGAIISCSVSLGAAIAELDASTREILKIYSRTIGLAFQIVDDILDITENESSLGKTTGKDALKNKPTYVSMLGIDQAWEFAQSLRKIAHDAARNIGGLLGKRLVNIADLVIFRNF